MSLAQILGALKKVGAEVATTPAGLTLRSTRETHGPSPELLNILRESRSTLEVVAGGERLGGRAPSAVRYVTRRRELAAAAAAIEASDRVGLGTRASGEDPLRGDLHLVQVAVPDAEVFVFDLRSLEGLGVVGDALRGTEVVGHDLQRDLIRLAHHLGLRPRAGWCTQVAARLTLAGLPEAESPPTREELVSRWFGLAAAQRVRDFVADAALTPALVTAAARDAVLALLLREHLLEALTVERLHEVMDLEMELLPVLVDMRLVGVGFDSERWGRVVTERQREVLALEAELREALGATASRDRINLNSPEVVVTALRRMGLDVNASSKADLSPHGEHPVVAALLRYRSLTAFLRGPAASLPEAASGYTDGRLRPHFDSLGAPTGRLTCSGPNLQGLEKARGLGRDRDDLEPRSCVVPSPGCVFVDADYATIELRVLAQVTKDEALRATFREGRDPHRATAAKVAAKPESEITSAERGRAKPVNFGLPFGMGLDRLVAYARESYGVQYSAEDAAAFKRAWEDLHPGVVAWQRRVGSRKASVVRARSGRLRRIGDGGDGYCQRLNMPVQGTAADGMKFAMVLMHRRLPAFGARLVLTVHDEVLVECPRENAVAVRDLVVSTMVEAMSRWVPDVPIEVTADIRATWAESSAIAPEGVL